MLGLTVEVGLRDTIMWIGGFVLAVIAAGLMVWSDIGDGPLIVVGMLGILFIAVGARVDEASTASQHACRYRRVNRSVQAVGTAGYGEWFPRLPAHSSCDFRWSLHHFRRDLSRWRSTEVHDGAIVRWRAERVVGLVGGG